jgi:hypothetical protein
MPPSTMVIGWLVLPCSDLQDALQSIFTGQFPDTHVFNPIMIRQTEKAVKDGKWEVLS